MTASWTSPTPSFIELVGRHWSGKHHAVVQGINLVSLLWTDGDRHIPCDYRIYHNAEGLTKNDHFRAMIRTAHERGFKPRLVAFDGWYSSLDNLKRLRELGWAWLTRLKANRLVNKDRPRQATSGKKGSLPLAAWRERPSRKIVPHRIRPTPCFRPGPLSCTIDRWSVPAAALPPHRPSS